MAKTVSAEIDASHAIINGRTGVERASAAKQSYRNGAIPGDPREWEDVFLEQGVDYYFGKEPSPLARMALNYWKMRHSEAVGTLVDLGCGEGRDAVFYSGSGFDVIAVDASAVALQKTARLAQESEVGMTRVLCDLRDYVLPPETPFIHANNSLQFLGDDCLSYLQSLRRSTRRSGLNAISVMTRDYVPAQNGLYLFDHNELKCLYRDWVLLSYAEEVVWREPDQRRLSFARLIACRP